MSSLDHGGPSDRRRTRGVDPAHGAYSAVYTRELREQLIDELADDAAELRGSVIDPNEYRRMVFHAEQRLADAKEHENAARRTPTMPHSPLHPTVSPAAPGDHLLALAVARFCRNVPRFAAR
ncbi:hypothetical protein ACLMAJ_12405 [Nocardia sp. KC 131]|uniref:hypothetical protein n=1 Tax=Nocardia arseniciresistens TaxID=3392119 RepID=UPI00398ECEC9